MTFKSHFFFSFKALRIVVEFFRSIFFCFDEKKLIIFFRLNEAVETLIKIVENDKTSKS
jgi:hypothetical protein